MSEVIVLYDGYSVMTGKDQMSANCSCTLLKGLHNVIIDTMTAWDSQKIITGMYVAMEDASKEISNWF